MTESFIFTFLIPPHFFFFLDKLNYGDNKLTRHKRLATVPSPFRKLFPRKQFGERRGERDNHESKSAMHNFSSWKRHHKSWQSDRPWLFDPFTGEFMAQILVSCPSYRRSHPSNSPWPYSASHSASRNIRTRPEFRARGGRWRNHTPTHNVTRIRARLASFRNNANTKRYSWCLLRPRRPEWPLIRTRTCLLTGARTNALTGNSWTGIISVKAWSSLGDFGNTFATYFIITDDLSISWKSIFYY